MREFFNMLWGTIPGFVVVVCYPPSERKTGKAWKDMSLSEDEWFQWPQQADQIVKYCTEKRKEDVYVGVAVYEKQGSRTKARVKALNVIHCDADGADPSVFEVPPTGVIESSPKRYQLYWQLSKPLPLEKVEPLARAISVAHRSDGADTGFNANKLLRVPGTTNTKPEYVKGKNKNKFPQVMADITGVIYPPKKIRNVYGEVLSDPRFSTDAAVPTDLPSITSLLAKMPSTPEIWDCYTKRAEETSWNPEGSRYKALWRLMDRLFQVGFSRDEVFVAAYHSANNKYLQDGRPNEELWKDVLKCERAFLDQQVTFIDDNEPGVRLDLPAGINLLTKAERKLIKPTFIDQYVEWARSKTRADVHYHEVNAMALLSTLLSEYGYIPLQYEAKSLHLWFMTLGITTRTFKTTAANQMLRIIDNLSHDREFPYEIASDPTPQALQVTLAGRGEISSIFHVDEAQGFIADDHGGGRGYMAGMTRLLTQLYDGKVPARDRVQSVSTKATKTHLTLHLMGVPGRMSEVLTRDDFATGFLARFIFVIGEPVAPTAENLRIEQSVPGQKRDMDEGMGKLLARLHLLVQQWQRKVQKNGGPVEIRVGETDDPHDPVWERYNEFSFALVEQAEMSPDPEAVRPTAQRMSLSVLKLACLLAMSNNRTRVNMADLLTAIQYGENWYDTMIKMAALVHRNQWARQVHDLVEWIGEERRSYTAVYRHFSNLKPREFAELVESAQHMGQIEITFDNVKNQTVRYLEVRKLS